MGDIPVIIGGIEASLRRVAHYDYWDDAVRRFVLVDSGADLLVYGMGELQVVEVARQLALGIRPEYIRDVAGTCWLAKEKDDVWVESMEMPSFQSITGGVGTRADGRRCMRGVWKTQWSGECAAARYALSPVRGEAHRTGLERFAAGYNG